jgi:hypothetical protein
MWNHLIHGISLPSHAQILLKIKKTITFLGQEQSLPSGSKYAENLFMWALQAKLLSASWLSNTWVTVNN